MLQQSQGIKGGQCQIECKEAKDLAEEMCNQDLDVLEQRQGSAAAVTGSGMVSKQSGEIKL